MANTCATETCNNETIAAFKYCMECYQKWKETQPTQQQTKPNTGSLWDTNPIVDQLMKINANLGIIARHINIQDIQQIKTSKKTKNKTTNSAQDDDFEDA